ncbi:hypothetical protein C8R44DRAFT_265323 [Mycena epipterygia]|nr:hypothetical protein C8R44DRAFT_265323 [Mycena epipterygia]
MDPEPAESTTRRATRTATKKRKSDTSTTEGSVPKRARITKKGRLAGLLSISLDVVFEIFGNLQPLDVLRLSRTSKEFRSLLMHKSSITIWRSSLSNVPNLPPCPIGMTEPQWTSLVFDPTCNVCQKIARKVDWGLFLRICGKCAKTHLSYGLRNFPTALEPEVVNFRELIPTRPDYTKPYKMVYFSPELENIKAKYNAIENPEEQKKFVQERKDLMETLKEHAKLCEAWSESVAENRSSELADLKEERFIAIKAKLTALGWGTELDGILPPDSLKSHKLVKQPHALTERTWKTIKPEMISYMEQMKVKRLAREHAALVVARKAIATKVLRTFKRSQLPWTDVMPNATDFWEFPEIKAVLEQPSKVDVDDHSFESMLPDFPGMIATWRAGLIKQMVGVYKRSSLEKDGLDDSDIEARLKLATTVFKCNTCGDDDGDAYYQSLMFYDDDDYGFQRRCRPLFWPRVLAHRCLTKTPDFSAMLLFMDAGRDVLWRARPLCIDTRVVEIVEKVVVACGMDPATTTVAEMDAKDPRLACHACAKREEREEPPRASGSGSGSSAAAADTDGAAAAASEPAEEEGPATVRAYSWRNAVRHDGEMHSRSPTAWYMLGDADAAAARVKEAAAMEEADEPEEGTAASMDTCDATVGTTVTAQDSQDGLDVEQPDEAAAPSMEDVEDAYDATVVPMPDEAAEGIGGAEGEAGGDGVRILPGELPELVWSCAHCLDSRQEKPPIALEEMLMHLITRHDVLPPAILNEDYYRNLAAPEVYSTEHFPAPSLKVTMPPAPPLKKIPARARPRFPFGFDDCYDDSDDDDLLGLPWY